MATIEGHASVYVPGAGTGGGIGARGYFGYPTGQTVPSAAMTDVSFAGTPGVYSDPFGFFDLANNQIKFPVDGWYIVSLNAAFAGLNNDGEVYLQDWTSSSETDDNVTVRRQTNETHNAYTLPIGPRWFNAGEVMGFGIMQNGDASDAVTWIISVAKIG